MNIIRRQAPIPASPAASEWDPFRMMRELTRWDPFRELGPSVPADGRNALFVPDVDVTETANAFVFKADLPGMKDKEIEITLTGNRLTLSGKRDEQRREEHANYVISERSSGSFTRSFTLPTGTDFDHTAADLKEGVLTITVPKKPEVQAKRIPVGSPGDKSKS